MSSAKFKEMLQRWPVIAYAMVSTLSERLDATNNSSFRDLTEKNHALQKAYDELKAAQEQLIEKERLERELKVAADIQLSILPDVLPARRPASILALGSFRRAASAVISTTSSPWARAGPEW